MRSVEDGTEPAGESLAETPWIAALVGASLFATTVVAFASMVPTEAFNGTGASGALRVLYPVADNVATVAFGASGAFSAVRHLAGRGQSPRTALAVVLAAGMVTGIGGGLLRDLLFIGRMPTLVQHPTVWALGGIGALIGLLLGKEGGRNVEAAVDAADFLALGLTSVVGFALARELAPDGAMASLASSAVLITVVTGCGGGLVRDIVLLRRAPSAFVSPYLLLTVGSSLSHFWVHVAVGGDIYEVSWPVTAMLVAVFGIATRNMRIVR